MSRSKVLLINPEIEPTVISPPLGLMYIASNLQHYGIEVKIIDLNCNKLEVDFVPDFIGISCITVQADNAYYIGKKLKRRFPNSKLVYGGVHPTALPQEPFAKGDADYVIKGEAETAFVHLIINGKIREGGVENLDDLPFPAYDLVDLKKYNSNLFIYPYAKELAADIITSRGCYNNCIYCASPFLYKRRVRYRSIDNVVNEVKWLTKEYDLKYFHFHDDNFLINPKRVAELCEKLKTLNIKWICLADLASIEKNINNLTAMSEGGCIGVQIGIESADPKVLARVGRQQELTNIKKNDKLLKNYNITPLYLIMSFNIGETIDSAYFTAKLLGELDVDKVPLVSFFKKIHSRHNLGQLATPSPGSEFFKIAKQEGVVLAKQWSDYYHYNINFIPNSFLDDIPIRVIEKQSQDPILLMCNGENRVRDIAKMFGLKETALAIKKLAMQNLIKSKT